MAVPKHRVTDATSTDAPPTERPKRSAKEKAADELRELSVNAAYLALFLCSFAVYRALITGEIGEKPFYVQLGTSVVTAIVIAKTLMIGNWLNLGKRSVANEAPLISRTLHLSIVYAVFVFVVTVIERILTGLLRGKTAAETLRSLTHLGWQEITARSIVILLALVPFLAFRELAQREGLGNVYRIFFHRPRS